MMWEELLRLCFEFLMLKRAVLTKRAYLFEITGYLKELINASGWSGVSIICLPVLVFMRTQFFR